MQMHNGTLSSQLGVTLYELERFRDEKFMKRIKKLENEFKMDEKHYANDPLGEPLVLLIRFVKLIEFKRHI